VVTVTKSKDGQEQPKIKVLVLVMSSRVAKYPVLRELQEKTWDSVQTPGVSTVYYMADMRTKLIGNILYVKGREDRTEMYTRTVLAIKELLAMDWDYIFKTDNSAYVNKPKLVETLMTLPRKGVYAGKLYHKKNVPLTENFLWGEGYVLSRDVASVVAKSPHKESAIDDVELANIMRKSGIPFRELPFYDYFADPRPLPSVHIYRCKDDKDDGWDSTINAINDIHKQLTETYYGKERRASQNGQHQEAPQKESKQKGYTRKDKTVKAEDQQALHKTI
jgi:hypothetical protein